MSLMYIIPVYSGNKTIDSKTKHFVIRKTGNNTDTIDQGNSNVPADKMLKAYLDMSSMKHKVISENIANVNTPAYKANDIKEVKEYSDIMNDEASQNNIKMSLTSEKHIDSSRNDNGYKNFNVVELEDPYEIKPNGNTVSLQQQMVKLSENEKNYNSAMKSYTAINELFNTVIGTGK